MVLLTAGLSWLAGHYCFSCFSLLALPFSPSPLLFPSLSLSPPTLSQMEEVSKKLAPILQVGDSHHLEKEDKMANSGQACTIASAPMAAASSIQEKIEVREAIRGRKESVIVKGTKVL